MAHIHIKNIGPIIDTGVITLTPVMAFIGKQSTGKSTLMKILCFCKWIEKRVMIGGKDIIPTYTHYYRFLKELMRFHRISDSAFNEKSYILYKSDFVSIELKGKRGNAKITKCKDFDNKRFNSKLSFIPAERNLLSAISNIENKYKSQDPDILFNYILEWNEVREHFSVENPLRMTFDSNMDYFYDNNLGDQVILHRENKTINTFFASSGVQSALPILGISKYVCSLVGTVGKRSPMDYLRAISSYLSAVEEPTMEYNAILGIRHLMKYRDAQLFIEEPEQNLFPMSQFELVKGIVALLKHANMNTELNAPSGVVFTTHSPYVITALNVLRLASMAYDKDSVKVKEILGEEVIIPADYYAAYSIEDGVVRNIMDSDTGLITGDYLDSVSDVFDEFIYKFNSILYANADC